MFACEYARTTYSGPCHAVTQHACTDVTRASKGSRARPPFDGHRRRRRRRRRVKLTSARESKRKEGDVTSRLRRIKRGELHESASPAHGGGARDSRRPTFIGRFTLPARSRAGIAQKKKKTKSDRAPITTSPSVQPHFRFIRSNTRR